MKRLMIILFAIGMTTMSSTCMAGMSKSKVRKEARFLTDKMSYELNLSVGQRNDAYEINYDFIYSVRNLMDDVLDGEEWAMDRYYYLLDIRNDDLRWVLSDGQYRRFVQADYFYRPIYASGNRWSFRIYFTYTNHDHFFFGRPYHYTSYHCDHYRHHYDHVSYYRNRYNHKVYVTHHSVRDRRVYNNHRTSDFSSVRIRPNTSKPRESVNATRRPNAQRVSSSASSSTSNRRPGSSASAQRPSAGQSNSVSAGTSTSTSRRPAGGTSSSSSVRSGSSSGSSSSSRTSTSVSNSSGNSGSSRSSSRSSVSGSSSSSNRSAGSSVSRSSSESNRSSSTSSRSSSSNSGSRSSSSSSSSGRSGSRR